MKKFLAIISCLLMACQLSSIPVEIVVYNQTNDNLTDIELCYDDGSCGQSLDYVNSRGSQTLRLRTEEGLGTSGTVRLRYSQNGKSFEHTIYKYDVLNAPIEYMGFGIVIAPDSLLFPASVDNGNVLKYSNTSGEAR